MRLKTQMGFNLTKFHVPVWIVSQTRVNVDIFPVDTSPSLSLRAHRCSGLWSRTYLPTYIGNGSHEVGWAASIWFPHLWRSWSRDFFGNLGNFAKGEEFSTHEISHFYISKTFFATEFLLQNTNPGTLLLTNSVPSIPFPETLERNSEPISYDTRRKPTKSPPLIRWEPFRMCQKSCFLWL